MKSFALALAAVAGLLIVGCEPMDDTAPRPTPDQPTQPQPQPGEPTQPGQPQPGQPGAQQQPDQQPLGIDRSDQEIAQEVRDRIQQEAQLGPEGRQVTVSVEDGQVTLSGQVQSQQESQQLEQIAADVAGQQNVQNELQVGQQQQQQQQPQQQPQQP